MSITEGVTYIQIASSILLIMGILLQQSEAALGGAFGGRDSFSSGFHTKRGAEKVIFIVTIVTAILYVVSSFSLLLI